MPGAGRGAADGFGRDTLRQIPLHLDLPVGFARADAVGGLRFATREAVDRRIGYRNVDARRDVEAQRLEPPRRRIEVTASAGDLDHPRWLYTLPNGDAAPDRA